MTEVRPPLGDGARLPPPTSAPSLRSADREVWHHVRALDGLRGVAVLAVILFHAGHLRGGFLGVDLFFTLSGFLITSLLLGELRRSRTIDLGAFWGRRFRRLLPAVLATLAVVLVVTWWIGSLSQLDAVHRATPPALVYLANWHQIADPNGYWTHFTDPSPLTHLWSLAIEEQFYVVWPLAFLALWKLTRGSERAIAIATTVAAVASAAWMAVLFTGGDPTRVYMGTDTRAFSILFGAAVAAAPVRRAVRRFVGANRSLADVSLVALVAVGAYVWATVNGETSTLLFEGGLAVHAALGAVLIVAVVTDERLAVSRVCANRVLEYVGTRSYGLYLWHWPVYVFLDAERTGLSEWPLTILRVAVSFLVAEASYRLVEAPIRFRAPWARGWSGTAAMAGGIASVAFLTVLVPDADAEIARFDPGALTTTTAAPATSTPAASSLPPSSVATTEAAATTAPPVATSPPTTAPTTTAAPKPVISTIAWMGDSVAFDAGPGVEAALTAAGAQVEILAYVGRGVVPTAEFDPIDLFVRPLVEVPRDLAIFQLSGWDLDHPEEEQRRALRAFRDGVRATGARVAFLLPPIVDPTRHTADFTIMLDEAQLLASEDPDGTFVLDSTQLWGTTYVVDMDGDGVPERKPDGVHVCPSGAALLGQWLTDQLAARFDGLVPADPALWAALPWVTDVRYNTPVGACSL